jgi:tetratricopeptide (TPR) repeat protein
MRKLLFLLFISLLLSPAAVFSCLNNYYTPEMPLAGGRLTLRYLLGQRDKETLAYWSHGFQEVGDLALQKKAFEKRGLDKLDFKQLSDYAVLELKTGDRKKGVTILEKLYAEHPEEYNIVANLGTAYELTGNDQKALELLKKAMNINYLSHYGSEWIHISILEQKLGPQRYDKIVDLRFADFGQWIINKDYVFERNPDSLKLQLAYQLHERISFIPAPDSVIGHLIMDFADLVAKTDVRDSAIAFYDYAARYNPYLQATINERKKVLKEEAIVVKDTFRWASVVWAIPLLVFGLVLAAWLKSIRRNKRSEV